jgi:poly(hydroxyalkanoate) depolymerase family esterase
MRGIADTIARLNEAAARSGVTGQTAATRLRPLTGFGANPGALHAHVHIPDDLPAGAPLVVVLHGCTQTAAGYDAASGWSRLADEQGFALLYPEQQRANNPNGCFNWFDAGDIRRGSGEAESIFQMIATVRDRHAIDPQRIFITGLSAGGAMTATMLATYPEVFAGGAIIAGLPHGVARDMVQAFDRMRGHNLPAAAALSSAVREASGHKGPWPKVSIWHGGGDATVSPSNADAILAQWLGVHGLPAQPLQVEQIGNVPHRSWAGPDGQVLVEDYIIPGMAHGTPLKTAGQDSYGTPAPFMLEAGISSTLRIAAFWGIVTPTTVHAARPTPARAEVLPPATLPPRAEPRRARARKLEPEPATGASGIGKVIEDALRAAGLMR